MGFGGHKENFGCHRVGGVGSPGGGKWSSRGEACLEEFFYKRSRLLWHWPGTRGTGSHCFFFLKLELLVHVCMLVEVTQERGTNDDGGEGQLWQQTLLRQENQGQPTCPDGYARNLSTCPVCILTTSPLGGRLHTQVSPHGPHGVRPVCLSGAGHVVPGHIDKFLDMPFGCRGSTRLEISWACKFPALAYFVLCLQLLRLTHIPGTMQFDHVSKFKVNRERFKVMENWP